MGHRGCEQTFIGSGRKRGGQRRWTVSGGAVYRWLIKGASYRGEEVEVKPFDGGKQKGRSSGVPEV
jgi:hypothetical protein